MKKDLLNALIIIIADILLLIVIFYLSVYARAELNGSNIPEFKEISLQDYSFVFVTIVFLMYYEKVYTSRYDFWQETKNVFKSLIWSYLIVLALLTLSKNSVEYSRLFITMYFLFTILTMPIAKLLIKKYLYQFLFFKKRVLVIGDKEQIETFKEEFKTNFYLGMIYDEKNYDMVIVSSPSMSVDEVSKNITKYLSQKSELHLVPFVTDINFANSNILEYSNIRHSTIQIENKLLIKSNIMVKNLFELCVTLMILPFFLIIHLFIALAISLDSKGGIFFKQQRLGKDDNDFTCYKYRTMYENSDEILKHYLASNPDEAEYYQEYHKYKNDPRVTKVGRFLRATSLDELAQIINVLKANMSLVGPRPYMISESNKLGDNQHFILKVKPGITGLWQVSGRNNLTFSQRNELEIWYIKNWSLWADFVILIKTIKVVLSKVGAK